MGVLGFSSYPVSTEKIVMNHYSVKSKEEYIKKIQRGNADWADNKYSLKGFYHDDRNEELDEGILKYRDTRRATLSLQGDSIETLFQSKGVNYVRLFNALAQNLLPNLVGLTVPNYFQGKTANFLTCLNLSSYLKGKFLNDEGEDLFKKISLDSIYKSLVTGVAMADIFLLIDEMPKILKMPYPAVENIRKILLQVVPQIMMMFRMNNYWTGWTELDHELKMLESFNEGAKNL